jgi:hypothetical protein
VVLRAAEGLDALARRAATRRLVVVMEPGAGDACSAGAIALGALPGGPVTGPLELRQRERVDVQQRTGSAHS